MVPQPLTSAAASSVPATLAATALGGAADAQARSTGAQRRARDGQRTMAVGVGLDDREELAATRQQPHEFAHVVRHGTEVDLDPRRPEVR